MGVDNAVHKTKIVAYEVWHIAKKVTRHDSMYLAENVNVV